MQSEIEIQNAIGKIEKTLGEIAELRQPRSDFVLRHFVVAQHDTPAAQRRQALDELFAALQSLYDLRDEMRLAEIDAAENESLASGDTYDGQRAAIHAEQARRKLRFLEIEAAGKIREVRALLEILDGLPKYTREECENEEREYWERRLSRQFYLRQIGDAGNLDAARMMETTPGNPAPRFGIEYNTIKGIIKNGDDNLITGGSD